MQYNLFIEHHAQSQPQSIEGDIKKGGVGTGWEDLFTNMLSFYFRCDFHGLDAFCRLILNKDFEKPVAIETQKKYNQGKPDIIITLQSGALLIIECKVDALLQPNQLQRYLTIKSPSGQNSFVALISKHSIAVSKAVQRNPGYKYPPNRPHFFWTDLFKALPKPKLDNSGSEVFRSLFSDYMELIGFAPSSLGKHWPKLYEDRTIEENQRVQKEFGRKLSALRSWLKTQDFNVTAVAHKGIQAIPESGPLAKSSICFLKIAPEKVRRDHMSREYAAELDSEVLRIALVYDSSKLSDHARRIYNAFPTPLKDSNGFFWWPTEPYKFSKDRLRLEFVSNLNPFLEKDSAIEERIKSSCVTIINKLSRIIQNIDHNT